MRIERVDDKTVKCFLSNEELEEYEIDYKDFIMRSEKAKEVVQEIIEQAEEEVGYKPPKFAFDLQIMLIPDQGLVLTFSEKEPMDLKDGERILECLKDMKNELEKAKEKLGEAAKEGAIEGSKEVKEAPKPRPDFAVFAFRNLNRVIAYAEVLPTNLRVKSILYCMNDIYYLYLQKGAASYERYSRACVQALEFGSLYAAESDRVQYLEEHAECVIAEQALKKLHF
ncbi:MAG: adaptor protein MecA [Lachnospiraceae bacterium]|nr:adaptor protein MecA [Lachnospiraceae bacterium]